MTSVTLIMRTSSKSCRNSEANCPRTAKSLWAKLAGRMSTLNSTFRSAKWGLCLLRPPCPGPLRFAETIMRVFGWFIMS